MGSKRNIAHTNKGTKEKFPVKMHKILEKNDYPSIISWQPHGRAFRIHDKGLFMKIVVVEHFQLRHSRSLDRQFAMYGFKRITGNLRFNEDADCHYHPLFLRGRLGHCYAMTGGKKG